MGFLVYCDDGEHVQWEELDVSTKVPHSLFHHSLAILTGLPSLLVTTMYSMDPSNHTTILLQTSYSIVSANESLHTNPKYLFQSSSVVFEDGKNPPAPAPLVATSVTTKLYFHHLPSIQRTSSQHPKARFCPSTSRCSTFAPEPVIVFKGGRR